MRIVVGTLQDYLAIGVKHKLAGEALASFASSREHLIEYEVNPETGEAIPVKIDGRSILHEPKKGVVPDHIRERLQGTPPDLRPGESM